MMTARKYILMTILCTMMTAIACTEESSQFDGAPVKKKEAAAAQAASGQKRASFSGAGGGGGGGGGSAAAPRTEVRKDLMWTWKKTCDRRNNCSYLACSAPEKRCYPCIANSKGAGEPGSSSTAPWLQDGFTCSYDQWACPYVANKCSGIPPANLAKSCKSICRLCGC